MASLSVKGRVRLGVLVSGRGSNLQAIIDASHAGRIDAIVAIVISDVADAFALDRARTHKIEAAFVDPKLFETREGFDADRKSTRLNSSHQLISYAVFCL